MQLPHDLIPSFPGPGGSMSHSDLMGRPRLVPSAPRPPPSQPPKTRTERYTSTSLDGHGHGHGHGHQNQDSNSNSNSSPHISSTTSSNRQVLRPPPRPGLGLRRVSSFSGSPGNQAGVGAVGNHIPAHSLPARSQGKRGSIIGPDRPPAIRRTSSHGNSSSLEWSRSVSIKSRGELGGDRFGHSRTASESTAGTIKRPSYTRTNANEVTGPAPAVPSKDNIGKAKNDGTIRLGRPDESLEISRLISTLYTLTPASRARAAPTPNSSVLHPSTLLTPLAIILESLVVERTILISPDQPIPDLPLLQTGQSLQLDPGEGEIDWTTLKVYSRSLGNIIDQVLPFIHNSQDRLAVEDMIKSVRMFVGKIKKVFAEVVSGYGDGYGFLKGWWDDGDMKGCAGEIGRWCDLFDV
jgi:hypothetical protein